MKIESKAMKEKERNYDKMTEEEALEILRKEWPDYIEETEQELLRKAVVFYHAISRESIDRTFNTAAIDALTFDKIRRDLFPVLRKKDHFDLESRKSSVKQYLHNLLCLTDKEKEFLTAFEGKEYMPELLFESADTLERLKTHPMALWKCRV